MHRAMHRHTQGIYVSEMRVNPCHVSSMFQSKTIMSRTSDHDNIDCDGFMGFYHMQAWGHSLIEHL